MNRDKAFLCTALAVVCLALWGCRTGITSHSTPPRESAFVLAKGTNSVLCEMGADGIHELTDLPFPAFQRVAMGPEGRMATFGPDRSSLFVAQYTSSNEHLLVSSVELPTNFSAKCTSFVGDNLYVGGGSQSEIIGFVAPHTGYEWQAVHVPTNITRFGKEIDELLLDGNRLIAVDNVILPKWLLLYDVSDPNRPKLLSTHELGDHGTWERVFAAALGQKWIAVLSITGSHAGPQEHLALYDRTTLLEKGWLNVSLGWSPDPDGQPPHPNEDLHWLGVTFLDNILLLPAGQHGVACLDLQKVESTENLSHALFKDLRYVRLTDEPEARVLDIVTCPLSGQVTITTRRGDELRHHVLNRQQITELYKSERAETFLPIYTHQLGLRLVLLRHIRFPEISFRKAHITDVAEFLGDWASEFSYSRYGDKPDPLEVRVDVPNTNDVPLITLSITNEVLFEAVLHKVCEQANLQYTYSTNHIRLHKGKER